MPFSFSSRFPSCLRLHHRFGHPRTSSTVPSVQEKKDERELSLEEEDETLEIIAISSDEPDKPGCFRVTSSSADTSTTVRTSSIRWKEPHQGVDDEPLTLHEPILTPGPLPKASSLKSSSADSRTKLLPPNESRASSSNEGLYLDDSAATTTVRSMRTFGGPSSLSSLGSPSDHTDEQHTMRMQGTISVSLEDVSLPGDSECGVGMRRRESDADANRTPRTWSFDDLSLIKRQLSLPPLSPSELDKMALMSDSTSPRASLLWSSTPHASLIDSVTVSAISKEDIVSLWRASERELLSNLQEVYQQKRALEQRVALLQKMLLKPP